MMMPVAVQKHTEILVVEDSLTQALKLQNLLEEHECQVTVAGNGAEGLAHLRHHHPDLIISDIIMPIMDGYEFCRQAKELPGSKDIPVILLTSLSTPEDVIKALSCNADNFITKPYDDTFLLSRIQHILINQELRQEQGPGMALEIYFSGRKHTITSDRMQIVDLLFSTYENAVERNKELMRTQGELEASNRQLQEEIAERQRTAEALKIAQHEAEKANKAKSEFLTNMSHELRSPLNSILVLSELLGENSGGGLSAKQQEFAKTINKSGHDLLTLIDDLLDLAKVEAGRMVLNLEEIQLSEFIAFTTRQFQPQAEKRGLRFTTVLADDLPPTMISDRQRMTQVVRNLLSNSFKFTAAGEVTLRIGRPEPTATFADPNRDPAETVAISITDTGTGIAPDKLELIFEAFTQADGSTSRKYGGTGLGLAISREFAHFLGGELQVRSAEGKGSTFTLFLPEQRNRLFLDQQESPLAKARTTPAPTPQLPPELAKKTVLIVEDDLRSAFSLMNLLESRGLKVLLAHNGKEGLAELRKHPTIDLVLMDILMPVMDGLAAIAQIRQSPGGTNLPVIALTAKAMEADRQQCLAAGASAYLSKPFNSQDLLQLLTTFLTAPHT